MGRSRKPKPKFAEGSEVVRRGHGHVGTVVAVDEITGQLSVDWPTGRAWHRVNELRPAPDAAPAPSGEGEGGDGSDA